MRRPMRGGANRVSDAERKDSKKKVALSQAKQKEDVTRKIKALRTEKETLDIAAAKIGKIVPSVEKLRKALETEKTRELALIATIRKTESPELATRYGRGNVEDVAAAVRDEKIRQEIEDRRKARTNFVRVVKQAAEEVDAHVRTGQTPVGGASIALLLVMTTMILAKAVEYRKKVDKERKKKEAEIKKLERDAKKA